MKLQSRVFLLMICILLFLSNAHHVQAATVSSENQSTSNSIVIVKDQFVITVSYGFSQQARYARYTTLNADIYNKGETMAAAVKATLLNSEQENITYGKNVILTGGEKTQVTIVLPMNRDTKRIYFSLEDHSGNTAVDQTIPLNIQNYGDNCMIGILSDDPIGLSYLQYFGNKTVVLDKNNLPSDYLAYDMLDTIVVDHFDLDSLEADKIDCLLHYVEMGGNLVLGINEDNQVNIELLEQYKAVTTKSKPSYVDTDNVKMKFSLYSETEFTKMLTSIRDYESNRNSLLQEIEDNKLENPHAGEDTYIGKSMLGTNAVTDLVQQEVLREIAPFSLSNADNVIEKDNARLYEQVSYGRGTIMIFHFCLQNPDITEDKLALYDGCGDSLFSTFYAEVAFQIKNCLSMTTKERLLEEVTSDKLDYRVDELSRYSEVANVPKVGSYIIVLIIYILILGPVSFFVLWKLKKQSRLWIVIPGISIVFFFIIYFMGENTRIVKPYAGYLNVEYFDDALPDICGSTYAFIGLSEKSPQSIALNTADGLMVGDNEYETYYAGLYQEKKQEYKFYDYTHDSMSLIYNDNGVDTRFYDRAAFNTELFRGLYHRAFQPLVISDLNLTKEAISGTITNHSDQTLYRTLLCLCGYYIDLGTLNPGDSIDLSSCKSTYMSSMDALFYSKNDISESFDMNQEELSSAQIRLIDAYSYAYDHYIFGSQEPYVIASFSGVSQECPFYHIINEDASYGESVAVAKVSLNETKKDESIVPSIDRYIKDSSIYTWDEKTRFSYVNSIDFTYDIPKSDHIIEIYLSEMFNDLDPENFDMNKCGRIYLYNYNSQRYDLAFDLFSKYGKRSIDSYGLTNYLNSDHQLMIRYESGNAASDVFEVPIISCRKETVNAAN